MKSMVVSSLHQRIRDCGVDIESSDVNMVWLDAFNNCIDPKVIQWDEDYEEHYYEAGGKRYEVEHCIIDETDTFSGSFRFPHHVRGWSLSGLIYMLNEYDGRDFDLFCRNNKWYVRYGDMETTEGANHPEGACVLLLEQYKHELAKTNDWINPKKKEDDSKGTERDALRV